MNYVLHVLTILVFSYSMNQTGDKATSAQLRRAAGSQSPEALIEAAHGWSVDEIDSMASEDGKNAVHMAAWQGCIENLAYLLDLGCSFNVISTGQFSYGKTPIFFAATRCRDDVVMHLLERGAFVKIVNNKGQSVLSIASSHLSVDVVRMISEKESEQTDQPWWNFRATHSDCLEYGDLDPRFLERPVRDSDIVTELAVNPTTKQSRRGSFLRRNYHFVAREAKQKAPMARRNVEPSLSPEEESELLVAWRHLEDDGLASAPIITLITVQQKLRRPWIPATAKRLRAFGCSATDVDTLFRSDSSLAEERQLRLWKRLVQELSSPSIPSGVHRPRNGGRVPPSLSHGLWKVACRCVENLNISTLESRASYLELPCPPVWVQTVDELKKLENAVCDAEMLAFDSEWAATTGKATVATIQLARGDKAWVVDLLCEERTYLEYCRSFLAALFRSKIMLGFALGRDIPKLDDWLGEPVLRDNCLDLQHLWPGNQLPGLACCAAEFTSMTLSKTDQRSDWSRRPLSDSQLAYAGLDAAVVAYILAEKHRLKG